MSWIKGFREFMKFEKEFGKAGKIGEEVKTIKRITAVPDLPRIRIPRMPRVKIPEVPKFKIPEIPHVRIPRKIPKFEFPKLRNPLAKMRKIKVFKTAEEIPEVAKAIGKAETEIPKAYRASKFGKFLKYGAPLAGLAGMGFLMGRDNAFAGGSEGGAGDNAVITYTVPQDTYPEGYENWWDWINPFNWFGGSEGGADYPAGEPYPTGYETLPPEAGYPDEGYVPPSYVPEPLMDYVAPAEGFAQDVLSAVEPLPVMGDLAGEAKRSGLALPFILVGGAGAYLAYKHLKKRRGRKK